MKAIKLASIFAVTAVAAAVSTTTIAAEPVFSGQAGLNYELTDGSEAYDSEGDLEFAIDTGVVYIGAELDDYSALGLVEAYVKQGAVSFGDFDGSISDDAVTGTGVYLETEEYTDGSTTDLGIQYSVSDDLTVAIEMVEGGDEAGFAVSYSSGMFAASAGSIEDNTNYAVGVTAEAGIATLGASYAAGEVGGSDFSTMILGADVVLSEAVSLSFQHNSDLEGEESNLDFTAYYTAGDITYFAANTSGDEEATVIGAYAEF